MDDKQTDTDGGRPCVVSIDNGFSGALVALHLDGDLKDYMDMPLMKGLENDIDEYAVRNFIIKHNPVAAFIEKAQVMPKQGISSSGRYMMSYGILRGILSGLGVPYTKISPMEWKKGQIPGYLALSKDVRSRGKEEVEAQAAATAALAAVSMKIPAVFLPKDQMVERLGLLGVAAKLPKKGGRTMFKILLPNPPEAKFGRLSVSDEKSTKEQVVYELRMAEHKELLEKSKKGGTGSKAKQEIKDLAIRRCRELYPNEPVWGLKKGHNIADALLIGRHGIKEHMLPMTFGGRPGLAMLNPAVQSDLSSIEGMTDEAAAKLRANVDTKLVMANVAGPEAETETAWPPSDV